MGRGWRWAAMGSGNSGRPGGEWLWRMKLMDEGRAVGGGGGLKPLERETVGWIARPVYMREGMGRECSRGPKRMGVVDERVCVWGEAPPLRR